MWWSYSIIISTAHCAALSAHCAAQLHIVQHTQTDSAKAQLSVLQSLAIATGWETAHFDDVLRLRWLHIAYMCIYPAMKLAFYERYKKGITNVHIWPTPVSQYMIMKLKLVKQHILLKMKWKWGNFSKRTFWPILVLIQSPTADTTVILSVTKLWHWHWHNYKY